MTTEQRSEPTPEPRYKAGDVCRMADVQPYVLRYWEAEFPVLAPDRSLAGPRTYSARDLKIIERIKKLLYDEGYTIAGAKKRLEGEMRSGGLGDGGAAPAAPADEARVSLPPKTPARDVADLTLGSVPLAMALAPDPIGAPAAPASTPEARARRPRGRVAVEPQALETPPLFDADEPAVPPVEATPDPVPPPSSIASSASDTRIALAVAELKEILELLSRDEP